MKRIYAFILLFSAASLFAMEQVHEIQKAAITSIPQYIYENCNQAVRHSWSYEEFLRLKARAGVITQEEVLQEVEDKEKFVHRCELYNWIHALNFVEELLKQGPVKGISVEHIKKINACLTRLTRKTNGTFRTESAVWPKQVSFTETYFYNYMHKFQDDILAGRDSVKMTPLGDIGVDSIKKMFQEAVEAHQGSSELQPDKVNEWLIKCPGRIAGTISCARWILTHYHSFPRPEEIEPAVIDLSRWSYENHDSQYKASYLHYRLIEIHAFKEANKRTGRAVSILFNLGQGDLPLIITGQLGETYVNLLKDGFGNKNGTTTFTNFIKNEMAAQKNACFMCRKAEVVKACSKCKNVKYCSIEHQKQDWPHHKQHCVGPTS